MPTLDSLEIPKRIFALFIGPSSSGKTTAAASFPAPHVLDFDGRIWGLKPSRKFIGHDVSFDQFLPPKGWVDVDEYLETLKVEILTRQCKVQTLIPDSCTALLRMLLYESLDLQSGRTIGEKKKGLRVEGPGDYKYEASAAYQVVDFLRGLPINIILTAHVIPLYGKPTLDNGKEDEFAESIIVGEKLSIRDKIGANILVYFNEVYRFDKREVRGKGLRYFVKFESDIARSALGLKGEHDITDKNFHEFWTKKVEESLKGTTTK